MPAISILMLTSLPTMRFPAPESLSWPQDRPKSLRSILVEAEKPMVVHAHHRVRSHVVHVEDDRFRYPVHRQITGHLIFFVPGRFHFRADESQGRKFSGIEEIGGLQMGVPLVVVGADARPSWIVTLTFEDSGFFSSKEKLPSNPEFPWGLCLRTCLTEKPTWEVGLIKAVLRGVGGSRGQKSKTVNMQK